MRKTLFKIHSYLALLVLLPVLIVSSTGAILVFKAELDAWLLPGVAAFSYSSAPARGDLNVSVNHIEQSLPDYVIGTWELFDDGREADRVFLFKKGTGDWFKIHYDPFANTILDQPQALNSQLTDWLVLLHYTFLLNDFGGEAGTLVGLVVAILLIALAITGLIIHRKFWRQLLTLRWRKSARVVNGDIHRLAGVWGAPVVLILGLTGAYFNTVEFYHEAIEHAHEEPLLLEQKLHSPTLDVQHLYEASKSHVPGFTPTYLMFPFEQAQQFTIFGFQPDANPLASNYATAVTFDKHTGAFLSAYQGPEAPVLAQLTDSFRELHFGSFGGLAIKILWSVLGFTPCILALTGFYLWLKRQARTKPSRRKAFEHRLSNSGQPRQAAARS
jgi:uncharacterized iron-regulated membrane protein